MKIIKLFLLLTFGVWGDFKLDVSNDINASQLENIVKNGWDDTNVILSNFIVSYEKKAIFEVLEKIKNPILKDTTTKEEFLKFPKILLNRHDYLDLIAYCKY